MQCIVLQRELFTELDVMGCLFNVNARARAYASVRVWQNKRLARKLIVGVDVTFEVGST